MRYIDADALIKKIFPYDLVDKKCYSINAKAVHEEIKKAPTADVVPKSEVEALEREIERLKKSMLPSYYSACSEEEAIKIGKQYGRTEVAREIFEEIEERIATHAFTSKSEDYSDGAFDTIAWVDSKLAELKKKYTEGE